MQPYDQHTSWVKSPWNSANFVLESPLNSLDLDLGKIIQLCNSFLAKVRESQGTWVPKARKSQGTLLKKIGWKPWRSVTKLCKICSRKSLFPKNKLTNLKNSGGAGSEKYIYPNPFCVEFFWYSPYSGKRAGSALHVTKLSRSGLPSLI